MEAAISSRDGFKGSAAGRASRLGRFAVFAWATLAYNILVILWGAFVRATGSGAGCGSHWPLCNGEVVPRAPELATVIELTHRATSGVALLLVVGLFGWALRAYPKGHRVRRGAALSLLFILTEALIGAGLVLLEHVASNASSGRVLSLSLHLVNTFILLAMLTLTAWWASGGVRLKLKGQGTTGLLLLLAIIATLVLGVSGAVAALGDTLFPSETLAEGIRQDFSAGAHFLIRLRAFHPAIAIAVAIYTIAAAGFIIDQRRDATTKRFGNALMIVVLAQIVAGFVNLDVDGSKLDATVASVARRPVLDFAGAVWRKRVGRTAPHDARSTSRLPTMIRRMAGFDRHESSATGRTNLPA